MKQTPLLFKTEMVRSIIAGTKTQTRRIIKGIPLKLIDIAEYPGEYLIENNYCPFGKPGDMFWVKENFSVRSIAAQSIWFEIKYEFEVNGLKKKNISEYNFPASIVNKWTYHTESTKKNKLFMPKAAARLWLQIESIKAERLNDITDEDAIAEGIELIDFDHAGLKWYKLYQNSPTDDDATTSPKKAFRSLWENINGPGSWYQNPLVWAIKFKQISKPENL